MKILPLAALAVIITAHMAAQESTNQSSTVQSNAPIALWSGPAPGSLGNADQDTPTLTPFFPATGTANGAAMIICPGGGYSRLAPHEGRDYARWLSSRGITCFVLKYRLGADHYRYPAPLQDIERSVRLVRSRAQEWNLDTSRVGVMGSSAGGHVASLAITHFDAGNSNATDTVERQSSRPDIGILCYPVITMGKFAHQGSKNNLIGANPPDSLVEETSTERRITHDSPPCFIWSTEEDKTVPIENTLEFSDALRQAGVPFELHIYQKGPHGQGLGSHEYDPAKWLPWVAECERWLKEQRFIK